MPFAIPGRRDARKGAEIDKAGTLFGDGTGTLRRLEAGGAASLPLQLPRYFGNLRVTGRRKAHPISFTSSSTRGWLHPRNRCKTNTRGAGAVIHTFRVVYYGSGANRSGRDDGSSTSSTSDTSDSQKNDEIRADRRHGSGVLLRRRSAGVRFAAGGGVDGGRFS